MLLNQTATYEKIVAFCLNNSKKTSLLLGAILTASLPPYYNFWAVFIAFSGVLFLCNKIKNIKQLSALGYWFGFAYFSLGFYWIGNALLVDISATGWLYPFVLILNGAFFGLFTILPFATSVISRCLFGKILIFAAVWCLVTEWLRSFLFTGFPWNPISSVLAFAPEMLQTLSIWGTYGLSMVLIIIVALPAYWLNKPCKRSFLSIFASLFLVTVLGIYGEYILHNRLHLNNNHSVIVRLVQPSIPQSIKWNSAQLENNLREYIKLSKGEDNQYVDFTIWGETAVPFDLYYDNLHRKEIRTAVPPHGYLITGFLRYDNGSYYHPFNSFGVINSKNQVVGVYDKSHLVPFGEYIPLRRYLPNWVQPLANTIAEFGRGQQYETLQVDNYPEFAPLICYEIIFSAQVIRKFNKPKWIIVLTNDGWYGDSSGPYQHLVAAQMRAVEEGVSVVRSANSGISAVINSYGEIIESIPLNQRAVIDVAVKLNEAHSTLFGHYGNIVPLTLALLVLISTILFSALCNKFKQKHFLKKSA